MKTKIYLFSVLLVLFLFGVSQAAEKIKIGVVGPLTGSQASLGTGVINGIKSAAKRINAQSGINGAPIELIVYDDRNSPDEGVSAARRLIYEDKVKLIIGSIGSSVTAAIQQLTTREKVLLVTAVSTAPKLAEVGDKYFFRVSATAEMRQKVFAGFLINNLKPNTIAYLAANEDLGRSEVENFEKACKGMNGPKTVYKAFYDPAETSFGAYLTKIKALNPDSIFIVGDSVHAAIMVKQIRSMGMKVPIAASAEASTTQFLKLAGDAAEGVYLPLDWSPGFIDAISKKFLNAYSEDYGKIPETKYAVQGWEAMWIVSEVISNAKGVNNPDKLREEFLKIEWTGPRGKWSFQPNGNPKSVATFVVQVKNGQFVRIN